MDLNLAGLNAVVTGGSRGIGREIGRQLAGEGCNVATFGRGETAVREAVAEYESLGVRAYGATLQGRDGDAVRAWTRAAAEALGGIDLVFANLSAGGGTGSPGYWRRNFEIDMMSAVRTVEEAMPFLERSRAPSILVMGSMASAETFVGPMAYNGIKAALTTWAQQLAQQLAPKGIRVNVVSPGPTLYEGSNWEMIRIARSRIFASAERRHPLKRMARPDEIARTAVFLASPAASWCQGANLLVDGGYSKRVPF
jgi:NAD(P)-dependent dehydrogenase (short-subunit alcohol dehydrogenase family)